MGFLVEQQVWAIVMVVVGSFILSLCPNGKKHIRTPLWTRATATVKPKEEMKPKSMRGSIMTAVGGFLCVGAFTGLWAFSPEFPIIFG